MNKQAKIITFSCLYILGIITFFSSYTALFSVSLLFLLYFLFHKKKLFSYKLLSLYIFIFLLGIINSNINFKYYDDLTSYENEYATVTAKVLTIPTNNYEDKTKFYADILEINTRIEDSKKIKAKSLITINDETGKFKEIKIGDTIKVYGKIKTPQIAKNPSQFDYARYLQNKKTFSLIYSSNEWEIISRANDTTGELLRKLNDTRNRILNIHSENIKSPMLEILGGIIFGDDAVNPDEETKESFINSGIFHILAASGMNVTLIFGIWFFFARTLKLNYRFSIITGILLILFYTCMTGFGPPIIRATLMLTLILIGKLIDREASTISLLFLVAFLMLLINPLMLFDIGFQLSFIVTFALIITAPLLVFNFKFKPINYILGAFLIPVIAQLFAAPLQLFYFNTLTIYSVFANIAIIPVLSIVSFIGFISSIIALIPTIAVKSCYIADIILNPFLIYIVKIAEIFSSLPYSIIYLKKPLLIQIILYFTIIIGIIFILKEQIKSKKYTIGIILLIVIFLITLIPIQNKKTEVIFFSVGNADSILIKSPDNNYFMIDTGKTGYLNSASSAKYIMLKYLKDKGIKKLNSLIITHFDADHAGGTIDILKEINVGTIYLTDIYEDTNLSSFITEYIKNNQLNVINTENIIDVYDKENFKLTIIEPIGNSIKTENQNSLIVHLSYNNKNMLFMGDGDIHSYETIPSEYKENISIIKIGHHGAKDTINNLMINNSNSFVISTGINPYNHPNIDTIKLLESSNKEYYRTDYHNAIKITIDKNKIEKYLFSPKTRKFIKSNLN